MLITVILLASFCSCAEERIDFTMYVSAGPIILDPQVSSSTSEVTSVLHLFKTLFRKAPNGKISAEAAEGYTVSSDGLVYTINLKDNQFWNTYKNNNEEITPKLTADDFVFGIQRVFMRETKSSYTDGLSAIKNSREVLKGSLDIDELGVRAIDELTLEITLSHPDPMFLERLCLPGAMPCNKDFFEYTKGAYGLSREKLLSCGAFRLSTWQPGTAIGLRKKEPASGEINYLKMIVPEDKNVKNTTAISRLESEDTNGELVTGSFTDTSFNHTVFSTTSWVLAFNCLQAPFDNADIRLALALSAYDAEYSADEDMYIKSSGLVPPSITMLDKSYREFASSTVPDGNMVELFRRGMTQSGFKKLSNVTVLVPNDGDFESIFSEINQKWQKDLSVFFSIKAVDRAELDSSVENGKYQIALLPIQQSENDVFPMLTQFSKKNNVCLFDDNEYNQLIQQIENTPHGGERAKLYKSAELLLLQKAPLIPLFYETSTYLYSSDIHELVVSPYGPIIDVTFAYKS